MNKYDINNREERYICSHLFRLLHENIDKGYDSPLGKLLSYLSSSKYNLNNVNINFKELQFKNISIYSEVALIRDTYFSLKPNVKTFMDNLVDFLMEHYKINSDCRRYSKLPDELNDSSKTHPEQIKRKSQEIGICLSKNEQKIYGIIQALFRAKPDLLITIDNFLIVIEAKYTQFFNEVQFERTKLIARIWAKLFYKELGFNDFPKPAVYKLGPTQYGANISWDNIFEIANNTYKKDDRSLIAFEKCTDLIKNTVKYPNFA